MPASALHNERELILLTANGDQQSFEALYDHYWSHVFSVALVFTKSNPLAEEITQDVFLKIWLNRSKLVTIERFDNYLFIIARNQIYNELRKKSTSRGFQKHLESYFTESVDSTEQLIAFKETSLLIQQAVDQLPPQQRMVFELSRNQGLEFSQIAVQMGISRLTVKTHMLKALQNIRKYLKSANQAELTILLISLNIL